MPSEEWFRENPKVSAYITKELHQKLESWMEENGVKKVSQALTEILEAFLEPSKGDDQLAALERKFEDRFAALENRIATIDLAIAEVKSSPKVAQVSNKQQLSFLDNVPKSETGQPEELTSATETPNKDSSLKVDQNKLKNNLTHKEVSDFTGLSNGQVEGKHRRGNLIEANGKVFTPIRESGKPRWKT